MPTKTDAILVGVGVLIAVYISAKLPGVVKASSTVTVRGSSLGSVNTGCSSCTKSNSLYNNQTQYMNVKLDEIEGIDLHSLNTVRQRFSDM